MSFVAKPLVFMQLKFVKIFVYLLLKSELNAWMSRHRVLWWEKEMPGRLLNGSGGFPSNPEAGWGGAVCSGCSECCPVFAEGSGAADGEPQGSPPEAAVQAEGWNRREAENHWRNQGVSSPSPPLPLSWDALGLVFKIWLMFLCKFCPYTQQPSL